MVTKSPKAAPVMRDDKAVGPIDSYFHITERGSTVGREIRGGLVTFFTMAYIIALNPLIIGTAPDGSGNLLGGLPYKDAAGTVIEARRSSQTSDLVVLRNSVHSHGLLYRG